MERGAAVRARSSLSPKDLAGMMIGSRRETAKGPDQHAVGLHLWEPVLPGRVDIAAEGADRIRGVVMHGGELAVAGDLAGQRRRRQYR